MTWQRQREFPAVEGLPSLWSAVDSQVSNHKDTRRTADGDLWLHTCPTVTHTLWKVTFLKIVLSLSGDTVLSPPLSQIKCWGENTGMGFPSSIRIWDVEDGPGDYRPWNKGCLLDADVESSRVDALSWVIREMNRRIRCVVAEATKVIFICRK